jgi:NAD(P)-dependent dehydrogenase (short-subunit alcohol dehydrogenase family)
MEFENKIAIVTGGSMGIGEASAKAFAAEGASVVLVDIDADNGNRVAGEINNTGGKAVFLKADVSNSKEVKKIPEAAIKTFGGIDILHNNAGIQHYGTVASTPEEEWDRVLGINLKSIYLCAHYCIPEMMKRGGGTIVNTASVQSFACQPNVASYTTSKAGILALTRSIAVDFAAHNIRANAVCPGSVDTPMLRWAANLASNGKNVDELINEWGKHHPIGRVAKPEEVAQVVLFLAGPRSSFVTGSAYMVDGGLLAKFF